MQPGGGFLKLKAFCRALSGHGWVYARQDARNSLSEEPKEGPSVAPNYRRAVRYRLRNGLRRIQPGSPSDHPSDGSKSSLSHCIV